MRMNSAQGKEILARIRGGDYAHPGETAAIDLVFANIPENPRRKLLDVGCGRGGTAFYLQTQGWGSVTGLDIDPDCIAYAKAQYPTCEFYAGDVVNCGEIIPDTFDLIYLFNSFYAFPHQAQALQALRHLAHPQTTLLIFDYTRHGDTPLTQPSENATPFLPHPIDLDSFPQTLRQTGWQVSDIKDLSPEYVAWYQEFLHRAAEKQSEIIDLAGVGVWDMVMQIYGALLADLQAGRLGGALIVAEAKS